MSDDLRQCWGTPRPLFDTLRNEFGFTVDACALPFNAKLERFWSPAEDGLARDWTTERVWCNPPYDNIAPWIEKAYWSTREHEGALAALLVPVRCDQWWWHQFAMRAGEISLFSGRIDFDPAPGITASQGREPSALVVYTQRRYDSSPSLSSRDSETGAVLKFATPRKQADIFEAVRAAS